MLPRTRILRSTEVLEIIKKGKSLVWGPFTFKVKKRKNETLHSRFALVVAKKYYKKAVTRNAIKRKLFLILRECRNMPNGFDIVVLMKGGVDLLTKNECKALFLNLERGLH